jgi:hypothetical protein
MCKPALELLEDRCVPAVINYHGGNVLTHVQVTAIFYGQQWQTDSTLQQLTTKVDQFFQYITQSSYMDMLSEYYEQMPFVGQIAVGRGNYQGHLVDSVSPQDQSLDSIQGMLDAFRQSGSIHPDSWQTLYFVFTPPGVRVKNGDGTFNTDPDPYGWGGRHNSFYDKYYTDSQGLNHGQQINYAVIPYPSNTQDLFASLTLISSHELAEAVTDPDAIDSSSLSNTNLQGLGDGWTTDGRSQNQEIGDLAEGSNLKYGLLNGYYVQAEWSNKAYAQTGDGRALPPDATQVYSVGSGDGSTNGDLGRESGQNLPTLTATALPVNNGETGLTVSQALVSFTESPAPTGPAMTDNTFTARISWGDGGVSDGIVNAASRSSFYVGGTHTYAKAGAYVAQTQITGMDGTSISVITPVSISVPNDLLSAADSLTGTAGKEINGEVGHFSDLDDAHAPASRFTVTVNWGDSQSSTGLVTANGDGTFQVAAQHTYGRPGKFNLTMEVQDSDGETSSATNVAKVTSGLPTQLVLSSGPQTLTAGQPSQTITVALEDQLNNPAVAGSAGVTMLLSSSSRSGILLDGNGNPLTDGSLTIPPGAGTASFAYEDNAAGSPSLTVTAVGLTAATQQETVQPTAADLSQSAISIAPTLLAMGDTATVILTARDAYGNQEQKGGLAVTFRLQPAMGAGSFGPVTDNGDGTYTATFTAGAEDGSCAVSGTINGQTVSSTLPVLTVKGQLSQLQEEYGFHFIGTYYQDYHGLKAKWFQDRSGNWYALFSSGTLRSWTRVNGQDSFTTIATVGPAAYSNPQLLFQAPIVLLPSAQSQLGQLEETRGFHFAASYWQNYLGLNEKWLQDKSGSWYVITTNGELRPWQGSSRLGSPIATVDPVVWDNPDLLFTAALSPSAQSQLGQLQDQFGFHFNGGYYQDYLGLNAKWLQDRSGNWYALFSDGTLKSWALVKGQVSFTTVAKVDPAVYTDPELLFQAPATLTLAALDHMDNVEQANGFHFAGSYWQNCLGQNEKWFQDRFGAWYLLTPDGQIRSWNGISIGAAVAVIDPAAWDYPELLLGS